MIRPGRDEHGFQAFAEIILRITDPRTRRKLWHSLLGDSKGSVWRLAFSRLVTHGRDWSLADYHRFMATEFPPRELVAWLERSVNSGFITRRECNAIEEQILVRTDRHGCWHRTLHKPDVSGLTAGSLASLPVASLIGALR